MADELRRDTLFVALTRPQMFAGVGGHGAGILLCLREPRVFDLWLIRVSRCPRVKNHRLWRCNSYRP
jgi:type IV secretion system protein VirB3